MIYFKLSDQLSHLNKNLKKKKSKIYRPTVRYISSRVRHFYETQSATQIFWWNQNGGIVMILCCDLSLRAVRKVNFLL
jgi:hypothetical protein